MTAMNNPGKIFLGVTPKPHRDYLLEAFKRLKDSHPVLVTPCVGRFTIPTLAVQAGYKPENLISSDISLFSSVLGCTIMGLPLTDLQVQYHAPELQFLKEYSGTPLEGGAILYGMKICQIKTHLYYNLAIREEILRQPHKQIEKTQRDINQIAAPLKGSSYRIKDIFEELEGWWDKENAVIFINPPAFKGGYSKMFDLRGMMSWNEPPIPEFDPTTGYTPIYNKMLEAPAVVILYQYRKCPEGWEDRAIFGYEYMKDRVDYLLTNKPELFEKRAKGRTKTKIEPGGYPLLFEHHTITRESKITFRPTSGKVALYYRDLFAHKLGATKAHIFYLAFIDGYLFATLGFHPEVATTGYRPYIEETFGFCVPNRRYPRLNKLMMMLICSEEFKQQIIRDYPNILLFKEMEELHTKCITTYPELKINRGILKLVKREKLPDGRYKLDYVSKFKPMTYQDCLIKWLEREKYG
jgi:hypothetical protein